MTRDSRNEANKLALTTDAMATLFPNAADMTEAELAGICTQLQAAQKTATCPYSDQRFAKDSERFIALEANGMIKVGVEECMKLRNIRNRRQHTALSRVFDPIEKLYKAKREAREHEERKRIAEERRIAEMLAKVQALVEMMTRINAVDQICMTPVEFSDWLIEAAHDRNLSDDDVQTYWLEVQRREDEATARKDAEEAAAASTSPNQEDLEQAADGVI